MLAHQREEMDRGQADRLMPMLSSVGNGFDVDALAVCTGPGNFTGIRIAVAAARGLAMAMSIPAVGVGVLESLAPREGEALVLADARQGRLYTQLYRNGLAVRDPDMMQMDEIAQAAPQNWHIVGHRAEEVAQALTAPSWDDTAHADLSNMARIAQARMAAGDVTRPSPLYLRPADAAISSEAPPVLLP